MGRFFHNDNFPPCFGRDLSEQHTPREGARRLLSDGVFCHPGYIAGIAPRSTLILPTHETSNR